MVVSILLPVLLFAAILFWRYYDSEIVRIEQELQKNARELSLILDRDLEGELFTLETLSTSVALTNHDFQRFYEQASKVKTFSGVDILLRDRTGQQLINTRLPWGSPLPRDKADARRAISPPYILRILADALLVLGLMVTIAWTAFLGFGCIVLFGMAV
jgi:hypothetical protein